MDVIGVKQLIDCGPTKYEHSLHHEYPTQCCAEYPCPQIGLASPVTSRRILWLDNETSRRHKNIIYKQEKEKDQAHDYNNRAHYVIILINLPNCRQETNHN